MITRERLQELIKNNARIFYIINNSQICILKLDNSYGISVDEYNKANNCKPMLYHSGYVYQDICEAEKCFESKEDAEWWLQYGNITRTETLSLPSWEEAKEKMGSVMFYIKTGNILFGVSDDRTRIFIQSDETLFDKPLTKENYTEACRLAKKLFLGENAND